MNIFLIGLMGAGKSMLAPELAKRLDLLAHDLDSEIADRSGRAVADIIREDGEAAFRELERDVLSHFLEENTGIVACGGGTPCFHDNMAAMRQSGLVVYLEMKPERLAQRIELQGVDRPLLSGLSGDKLVRAVDKLLDQREAYYRQAHIIWNAATWDVGGLVRQLNAYSK